MSDIGLKIAKLSNPNPQIFHSEGSEDELENVSDRNDTQHEFQMSELRSKNAPLLEDIDSSYVGRKVSRKSRNLVFEKVENRQQPTEKHNISFQSAINTSSESGHSDSDLNEETSDEDITTFKNDLNNESKSEQENSESSGESEVEEEAQKEDMISKFANIDVTSDIEKGKAIKAQEEIWNKLCEARIKLQKLLIIANKLPQTDSWHVMKNKSIEDMSDLINKDNDCVKLLLNNLINLQNEFSNKNIKEQKSSTEADIDIRSDSEEEVENFITEETVCRKGIKRKFKNDDYSEMLSKQFKSEKSYRSSVIEKWDEKVRLSTGRMTQKSFNAFGNSAVKQIDQILQDKSRIIKRTQLKRSAYRVLGKPEFADSNDYETNTEQTSNSKQDILLKDYDSQIFDDDDFYRQLLKDIIQSKSFGMDPTIVRKQMELQKIRNKMKRKIDTKASKGRKLRYDIHPKLVNYMAPMQTTTISDEARETLLTEIFGRKRMS